MLSSRELSFHGIVVQNKLGCVVVITVLDIAQVKEKSRSSFGRPKAAAKAHDEAAAHRTPTLGSLLVVGTKKAA